MREFDYFIAQQIFYFNIIINKQDYEVYYTHNE
jgi:hypothetical protein